MGISPLPSLFKLDSLLCSIELSGDWLGLLVARYILHHQSIVDLTQSSVLETKDNPFQILWNHE
jgi:hypothetical protein